MPLLSDDPLTAAPVEPANPESPGSRKALRFCVLGSGSGGNSSVIALGDQAILVDAGFGPRTIGRRLEQAGLHLRQVRALCLTHLDQDHFRPHWVRTLVEQGIGLYVHRWHLPDLHRVPLIDALYDAGLVKIFEGGAFLPLGGAADLEARPVRLPHDRKGTVGFRFESGAGRIGYATDLGRVPRELIDVLSDEGGVDLLAIESNYDPPMQEGSHRPAFLKRRIMGGHGHLSNQEAFEAVQTIAQRCAPGCPSRIVLLHRSDQCNCPTIVQRVFDQNPHLSQRVMLAQQRRRSPWIEVRPLAAAGRKQLTLGF
ncbi:MAG: MBL fold metallo-hydrolase [Phycisphaeraceae bacterium]